MRKLLPLLIMAILLSGCARLFEEGTPSAGEEAKEEIEEEIREGPGPNLVVQDIDLRCDATSDPPKCTHLVLIKNVGDASAEKFRASIVIEPPQKYSVTLEDGSIEYRDYSSGTFPVPGMAGKEVFLPYEESVHSDYFQVFEEGTVTITVYADHLNQVLELNETDNELAKSFNISFT